MFRFALVLQSRRRVQHRLDDGVAEQPGLGMDDVAVAADDAREGDDVGWLRWTKARQVEMGDRGLRSRGDSLWSLRAKGSPTTQLR